MQMVIYDNTVEVRPKKKMVHIWDYQLSDIASEIIKEKTGIEPLDILEWEDGEFQIYLRSNEASEEDIQKILVAFQIDFSNEDLEDDDVNHAMTEAILKEIFGKAKPKYYFGNESGRGDTEIVFDLEDEEYEFFKSKAKEVKDNVIS